MKDEFNREILEDKTGLTEELQQALDKVGPANYGKTTAHHFSKFGTINKHRPRYAVR